MARSPAVKGKSDMRHFPPPNLATWLLKNFGTCRMNDCLIGDLLEEYGSGRSDAWYWKQVLMAVAIAFYREISAHKLLAVRAVLVGHVFAEVAYSMLELPLFNLLSRFAFGSGLVAGTWWMHGYIYPWAAIACLSAAGIGWVVARLHRSYQRAMVFVYAVAQLLFGLPEFCRLLINTLDDTRFLFSLLAFVIVFALSIVSTLLGGFWGASHKSEPQDQASQFSPHRAFSGGPPVR